LPTRHPEPLVVPTSLNFLLDEFYVLEPILYRRFRTFNLVDDFNREILAIQVDLNLPPPRVTRVLERVIAWRGYTRKLRMDNGPEFISTVLTEWAEAHDI